MTIADLDDPPPDELIASGVDVVLRLHGRGAMTDRPVRLEVVWKPGLVPGEDPPPAVWIRWSGDGYELAGGENAA
jgi:hypothetical protein